MTDDAAFRNAILAAPDDDAPRLVYADWLEERGDPRAEFVRPALPPLPVNDPYDLSWHKSPAGRRWRAYAARLLGPTVPRSWRKELAAFPAPTPAGEDFPVIWGGADRPPNAIAVALWHGFVTGVCLTCRSFLRYAGPLFAAHPIRSVALDREPVGEKVGSGCRVFFLRERPGRPADRCRVPDALFDGLTSRPYAGPGDGLTRAMEPPKEDHVRYEGRIPWAALTWAYDDLSAVAVAHGRRAARALAEASRQTAEDMTR
jgi:uncharacterized protein (TIGR02996 family)